MKTIYNENSDKNIIEIPKSELIDVVPITESFSEGDKIVLVTNYDINGKEHFVACSNMELAKKLYPNCQKNQIPYFICDV